MESASRNSRELPRSLEFTATHRSSTGGTLRGSSPGTKPVGKQNNESGVKFLLKKYSRSVFCNTADLSVARAKVNKS